MDMGHRPGWSRGRLEASSFSLDVSDLLFNTVHINRCLFLAFVDSRDCCSTHDTLDDL